MDKPNAPPTRKEPGEAKDPAAPTHATRCSERLLLAHEQGAGHDSERLEVSGRWTLGITAVKRYPRQLEREALQRETAGSSD